MRLTAIFLLTAALGFLPACNSKSSSPSGGAGSIATSADGSGQITGAGSTFVYPIMARWIEQFQQGKRDLRINYQSIGSGGGIQQLKQGVVDFGASDAALDDEKLKGMPPLVQIAESAGPICITYNLQGLTQPLKLSGKTLSGIYLGTVTSWQDAAIKKDNPGVNLPNQNILVVHRSDGSGTTNIFTSYLAAVNPDWKTKVGVGLSVSWPLGLGGKGSEGVTGMVKQNPGAIGYVELTYADENKLPIAQIQNQAGKYVAASAQSASSAIEAFAGELKDDIRKPVVNPPASAADAYPISGLTFLLIPKQAKDPQKATQVKDFAEYVIGDGQSLAEQLHYAKIPTSLQQIDKQLLDQVQGAGSGQGQPGVQ